MSQGQTGIKVVLAGVTYRYRRAAFGPKRDLTVLRDFDLECAPSEITAILGPSGCGKSTILDLIARLKKPTEGTVALTNAGGPVGPRLAFIFQRENCLPWLNIKKNLIFGLDVVPDNLGQVVGRLNLGDLLRNYPHELSGGQQQRVAIARLLLRKPDLILCDEPWSSLDIAMRRTVETEVRDLVKQVGATCVLVTHEPSEALRVADRILVLTDRPARIVHDLDVTDRHRSDPVEIEKFITSYLSTLDEFRLASCRPRERADSTGGDS